MDIIQSFKDSNDIELLDKSELKSLLRISEATLWRYLKKGKIPQPRIYISKNKHWWDKAEVLNHITKNNQG